MLSSAKIIELVNTAKTKHDIAYALDRYEANFNQNYHSHYTLCTDCFKKDFYIEKQIAAIKNLNYFPAAGDKVQVLYTGTNPEPRFRKFVAVVSDVAMISTREYTLVFFEGNAYPPLKDRGDYFYKKIN